MATHTDKLVVISNGVPTRVGATDTVELSSGNLKVGGDLTANGEVTLDTSEAVNISGDSGVSISSGTNEIGLNPETDSIDVDATGVFGVVSASANFTSGDNTSSAFLVEDSLGLDYFKIATTDSSEELILGNTETNPDFNFIGSGKILITSFEASETIYAGQALCLTSASTVGLSQANIASKAHIIGIASETCALGGMVKMVSIPGVKVGLKTNLSGNPAVGSEVYLSQTPGDLTTEALSSSGTTLFKAGYVLTTGQILFQPQFIRINN